MKSVIALLVTFAVLSACASPANQQALATLQSQCTAGNDRACALAPLQQQINAQEGSTNAMVTMGAILGAAVVAGDAYAASHSSYQCYSWHYHRYYWC